LVVIFIFDYFFSLFKVFFFTFHNNNSGDNDLKKG